MTVMFDSTFLGTLASVPSAGRSHPGLLVEAGGHRIMVDCGEGHSTPVALERRRLPQVASPVADARPFRPCAGIQGLFSMLRLRQSSDLVTIHGGKSTLDVVVRMLAGLWGKGRPPIR
jgi:ribonuclease Z